MYYINNMTTLQGRGVAVCVYFQLEFVLEMSDLPAFHRRSHIVRHHECGADGKMKLPLLMDCLQDIAAEHAEKLGCGMEDLQEAKRIWVLSRLKIRVLRFPELKEDLELLTYPSGHDRLFAHRQYSISANGEEVIQGSSAWLMLDGTTYRPQPMEKVFAVPLPTNDDRPRYFEKFEKIADVEADNVVSYTVGTSDIDLNLHLNNAVYARYIEDLLGVIAPGSEKRIKELQINFQHAGQLGDKIECAGVTDGNIFRISGGKYFLACGTFAEIKQ